MVFDDPIRPKNPYLSFIWMMLPIICGAKVVTDSCRMSREKDNDKTA
jgi:hypothetical protein